MDLCLKNKIFEAFSLSFCHVSFKLLSLWSQKCTKINTIFLPLLFSTAMEFHENLHNIGAREGLKERKLQKSVESFTWNITILKVMCLPLVSYCIFLFKTVILILLLVITLCHSSAGFIHFYNHSHFSLYNLEHSRLSMWLVILLWCYGSLLHLVCLTFSSCNLLTLPGFLVIFNIWLKHWVLTSAKWVGLEGSYGVV